MKTLFIYVSDGVLATLLIVVSVQFIEKNHLEWFHKYLVLSMEAFASTFISRWLHKNYGRDV